MKECCILEGEIVICQLEIYINYFTHFWLKFKEWSSEEVAAAQEYIFCEPEDVKGCNNQKLNERMFVCMLHIYTPHISFLI